MTIVTGIPNHGFNRTKVGLKDWLALNNGKAVDCFNRTKVGLKAEQLAQIMQGMRF